MTLRRILAAVAVLCAFAAPAQAQKTKAQLNTEIGVQFPDNTGGQITAANLRAVTNDIVNAIMPTAPVVSGSLACFDGTTGLLRDCATSSATLTLTPPPNTVTQALLSTASLPSTGTSSTTFNFNEFNGTNPGYTVSATTIDEYGGFPSTNTLRANYTASGGSPINSAIWGAARQTAPTANLTGVIASAYSNISAPADGLWGAIGFTSIDASGNVGAAISVAGESIAGTGAVIGSRVGVAGVSETNVQGTNLDAAFAVATGPSPGVAPYLTTGPWKYGFVLSRILYGNQGPPLSIDGKALYADTAFTTADFADMSAVTFTGKLFNFTNYAMDSNGYTVLGAGTPSLPTGDTRLSVTGASRGRVETFVSQNGTTGVDGFQITTTAADNQMFLGAAEPSNTTTRFGVTLGNYGEVVTYSASNNGLLIGTIPNKPVILGTNNTEIMRLAASGGVTVPSTVTGGDKGAGTVNATGLYVGGTAVLVNGGALGTPSSGVGTNLTALNASNLGSGAVPAARMPALTGDATTSAGAVATTVTKINGVDQTTAWTTYTPTITSQTGTITTSSATGRYKQIGKTVFVEVDITVTTAGTGAGSLLATLPLTAAANNYAGSAYEYQLTGKSGAAIIGPISATQIAGRDAAAVTFIANGAKVIMCATYELP
jgi:hypothetical protein